MEEGWVRQDGRRALNPAHTELMRVSILSWKGGIVEAGKCVLFQVCRSGLRVWQSGGEAG